MFRKSKVNLLTLNILLSLLMIFAGDLSGQNYTIKSYTTSDGLPHNNVRAIARDSSGFLWLGTWDGLSRFDGHEFKNYFHEPDDTTSIPFFSIYDLVVDRENNLWIFTDTRDLVKYNRNNDNFRTITESDGITRGLVNSISSDPRGNLIILCTSSLIILDPGKNEPVIISLTGTDNKPFVTENIKNWISYSGDSTLWLTGSLVREFRRTGAAGFQLINEYQIDRSIMEPMVYFDTNIWRSIHTSASGNTWLLSNNGLYKLDKKEGIFREYSGKFPMNEFTGKNFFFWAKRNKGIYFYNSSEQLLTHVPEYQTKWSSAILPDEKGTFWFAGISDKGVAQGVSLVSFIPGYFKNSMIPSSDSTRPAVYSIVMDNNKNIWTGVRGYDHIVVFADDGSVTKTDILTPETQLFSGHIRSLVPVPGGIWIGYFMNLLKFYDSGTGKFTVHHTDAWGYRAVAVRDDGKLYIGTDKIILYDPLTGKEEILWNPPEPLNIFRVFADTSGIVWAGMSESRLLKYNITDGQAEIIKITRGICNIEDIVPGENGDLWLALLGKGVCRFNTLTGNLKFYTTSGGLSNNTTYSILRDNKGHIWVSTNHGISMIHPESGYIRIFNESDGIAITEFNSGAKYKSDEGEFFFGGMGGFIRFHPDSVSLKTDETPKNKILITHFEISGESRRPSGDLNETDTIILARGENNFHVTFSSSDFVNSDKTKYRYMLSGVNNRWTVTGSRNRNINYSNLKPGWYDLIIEAANKDGDWTASKKIRVRIKPLFYQTRIFRILMPLVLLFIIISSIILYIRQLQQKERSKQDELKLQSLRSQMNPHFIFNSLNSINYFISNNDKLSANRYIADFSRLIRSILSNMGSNFIPLENEINSIRDYLRIEHLRFGDKFDYCLETNEIKEMTEIEVCPGIVQPFIENAIWHGVRPLENRKGFITIRFIPDGDEGLKCIIEDDGIGRTASLASKETNGSHKPKGISIITERLQITGKLRRTNYSLEINDLSPGMKETGTRVEVDIPAVTIKRDQHDKGTGSR